MLMMHDNNYLALSGIVPFNRGSLGFLIIENKLFLEGGKAIDSQGHALVLSKNAYEVLDDIRLITFENHCKYYFYIRKQKSLVKSAEIEEETSVFASKNLADEITFFISKEVHTDAIMLAEVEIDYAGEHLDGKSTLHVASNVFSPRKNEIDIRFVSRQVAKEMPTNQKERLEISRKFYLLAKTLHRKLHKESIIAFSTLSAAFFTLAQSVELFALSPYMLYQKLEFHCRLFAWVEAETWGQEGKQTIDKIVNLLQNNKQQYSSGFYYFDLENKDGFFHKVVTLFSQLNTSLLEIDVKQPQISSPIAEAEAECTSSYPLATQEETDSDDETSTVLLGIEQIHYIQVGRGIHNGNDIIIGKEDRTVSRIHLKVTPHRQGFFIEDLSTIGTYVDDKKIDKNNKKFVTSQNKIILGKNNCELDLSHFKIQGLLD